MKVLITGGTGNLGQTLISEFYKDYDVYFTYHKNLEKALKIEKDYNVKKLSIDEVYNYNFDIIINNAAISGEIVGLEDISLESWKEVLDVNVTLPFTIIKNNLKYMKNNHYGRIINISSVYAIRSEIDLGAFNTSKSALIGLTKSVAKEYAKYGITSNAILPGTFKSEVSDKFADIYSNNNEEKDEYYENIIGAIPAGRLGNTKEISKLVKFIASDDASYINGAVITIDGGYLS